MIKTGYTHFIVKYVICGRRGRRYKVFIFLLRITVYPTLLPSLCMSVCPSVSISLCPFVRMSVHLFVRASICPFLYPFAISISVSMSFCPTACASVYPSFCLSVYLLVRPYVWMSVLLSVCLSAFPSINNNSFLLKYQLQCKKNKSKIISAKLLFICIFSKIFNKAKMFSDNKQNFKQCTRFYVQQSQVIKKGIEIKLTSGNQFKWTKRNFQ